MNRRNFFGVGVGLLLSGNPLYTEEMSPEETRCFEYLENVFKYLNHEYSDDYLMSKIESQIDIPEQGADDFRRNLFVLLGQLYFKGEDIKWDFCPHLTKAIRKDLTHESS